MLRLSPSLPEASLARRPAFVFDKLPPLLRSEISDSEHLDPIVRIFFAAPLTLVASCRRHGWHENLRAQPNQKKPAGTSF
jgi:hypothetical protein